jgi:hypothetical protein
MERLRRNAAHLRALYEDAGPRLGLIYNPPGGPRKELGDYIASERPVSDWVPYFEQRYEWRMSFVERVPDDSVPYVSLLTNTGFFPAAFGAELHTYDVGGVAARPLVFSSAEAAALEKPDMNARPFQRFFQLAELLQERLGPEAPLSVPDIQSPFGIAAIIWDKADFLLACAMEPGAVQDLTDMCGELLVEFLQEFEHRIGNRNMCHCPDMWVPPDYGCHLSEDEIGVISPEMFEQFCLPWLTRLSEGFGGLWIHCCADADHQYESLARIPNLMGLNRKFFQGAQKCIDMFSDRVLFSFGCDSAEVWDEVIDCAHPDTRLLFSLYEEPDEACRRIEHLRERVEAIGESG